VKAWAYTPCDIDACDDDRITCSADIIDPQGRSIFDVDLGDFFGISTKTAERIVNLLNRPTTKPKRGKK
jgi:hypothetical protein